MRTMISRRVAGASSDLLNAISLPQQHAAVVFGEQRAAVERIDDQSSTRALADVGTTDEKMPGEIDAVDVQSRAPRHFHVDEGQRDRNACAPIEHLVETAVTGILVPLAVADESLFLKEVGVQGTNAGERRAIAGVLDVRGNRLGGGGAHAIELRDVRFGDQAGILDARDHQGCMRQRRPRSVRSCCQRVDEVFLHKRSNAGIVSARSPSTTSSAPVS
jgi:hypothetical protein